HAGFKHLPSKESELVRLTSTIFRMVEKGEVLSSELIRTQLIGSLARYDVLIRFCLNAFVISGLLGTLYNLWKLGPKFWAGLISGQENAGQSAIGIAFSASVIGLGCALLLSFVDSFFIRYRREAFVREAANNPFHR